MLPSLNGRPTPMPVAGNGTSVHLAVADTAVPLAVDPRDGSAPILPQRTTGHSMSAQRPGGSLLRNWPMLVIILAMIAIVTAVVIMVMPADSGGGGGKRQLMPAPSPDRMETMPDKSSQADPWAAPGDPRNQPVPDPNGAVPRVTPDPPAADDTVNPDPDDLYGGLNTPGLNGGVFIAMANQACKKLKTCSNVDQSALSIACDAMANMPLPPVPSGCDPAKRCMDAIDHIDCDTTSTNANPMNMLLLMQDCTKAATEC